MRNDVWYAAGMAVIGIACAIQVGCGGPTVEPLESEYGGIEPVEVADVSSLAPAQGEMSASFGIASAILSRPVDRVTANWEAYAEGGTVTLEANGVPFAIDFEELVPETGLTLYVGHAELPAGTETIDARLVLTRRDGESLPPVVTALSLDAFTLAEVEETGEPGSIGEDDDVIEGVLLHKPGIVSRDAWNAKPPRCTPPLHDPFRMTFHHTVSTNGEKGAAALARMRQIQAGHFARGFCDVAYHFVVDAEGKIYRGRGTAARQGGHTLSQNDGNIGVALMGSFVAKAPTNEQLSGLIRAFAWQADKWNIPVNRDRVRGHTQWPGQFTACPSKTLSRKDFILRETREHIATH